MYVKNVHTVVVMVAVGIAKLVVIIVGDVKFF
jgi:hypothetical protein